MDTKEERQAEAGRLLRKARAGLYSEDGSPLSQKELGTALGYSHQRVSAWENGNLPAGRDALLKLLRAYRLDREEAVQFMELLDHDRPTQSEWDELEIPDEETSDAGLRIGRLHLPGMVESVLRPFEIGKLKLPLRVLVGGNGQLRYSYPDGARCVFHARKSLLPEDVLSVYSTLLTKRKWDAGERRAPFEQREMVRLDDYEIELSDPDELPWPIILHVSLTDYFTRAVTNHSLDEVLPDGQVMRRKYGADPADLAESMLANPLAVSLSIVTSDDMVCVALRGRKVATNPGGYSAAVSGTGNLQDFESPHVFSPFLTARREAHQEATGFYYPELREITFFGLARTLTYYDPFLFGEIRLPFTWDVLKSMVRQDAWETEMLIAMPLEPEDVVSFVQKAYTEMYETGSSAFGTYTAIFSLYQSLLYRYPDQWLELLSRFDDIFLG